jgi:hypothetical protein
MNKFGNIASFKSSFNLPGVAKFIMASGDAGHTLHGFAVQDGIIKASSPPGGVRMQADLACVSC